MIKLLDVTLIDLLLERVRRNFADAIAELQRLPFALARVHLDRTLTDGVATPIAHGLGRKPVLVLLSPVRGPSTAGMIQEVRDSSVKRELFLNLKASGYGATVVVDVVVL